MKVIITYVWRLVQYKAAITIMCRDIEQLSKDGKMGMRNRNAVLCPKCKSSLMLSIESEKKEKQEMIIRYLYVCISCGYKNVIDQIIMKANGDKIFVIRSKENSQKSLSQ
jgi:C4-type Zn-finger protein